MRFIDYVQNLNTIVLPEDAYEVEITVAEEFRKYNPKIKVVFGMSEVSVNSLIIASDRSDMSQYLENLDIKSDKEQFICTRLDKDNTGIIYSSHKYFLFSYICSLLDNQDFDIEKYKSSKIIELAFKWNRASYDYFLTQEGRIQKGLNRETYIRELARFGFTHIEVNGLGFPMALENGPAGETYPMFYTYCPALDQFVKSNLNEGLYPDYYLSANMAYLKENADLAKKYGLVPGLLSFEPRNVPEEFFDKYPMLRGARVDHPFRSFKPRYNMTITHPLVLEHYEEMLKNLMNEVPDLGFFSIWTNDSGAGFEHTKSLYVGRNGGAYLIREWKDDAEISKLAGDNALQFFRTLRDAGREINPDFRILTRMESFYGEHETVWNGMGDGLELETASLAAKGWSMPYSHPKYEDTKDINGGTIYQQKFDVLETENLSDLRSKNSEAHYYFASGSRMTFEPLLGISYPKLTHQRLKLLYDNNVTSLAQCGGTYPPEFVPYNLNHAVMQEFTFNQDMDIDSFIKKKIKEWSGSKNINELLDAFDLIEESIIHFPNITGLYTTIGFAWYRLWVRPFIPNLEAVPEKDRKFYESFMCTTPHNPNNVDLSRDVLFTLADPEKASKCVERIDKNVLPPIDKAIKIFENLQNADPNSEYIKDQLVKNKALKCWFMTQRNVGAWIKYVYGYMNVDNTSKKEEMKASLKDSIEKEIINAEQIIELFDSGVEFIALTDKGETPLMYGTNLKDLIGRRIELMKKHKNDEPYIDHNYIERQAGKIIQ